MAQDEVYRRELELYDMFPDLSEDELRQIIASTIQNVESVVLETAKYKGKINALLKRDYHAIIRDLRFEPNALFLASYADLTSAGMFMKALAGEEKKRGNLKKEKALLDGQEGLVAICVPFQGATDPTIFSRLRRESLMNRALADETQRRGFDMNSPENLRVLQNHTLRLIGPIRESLERQDQTGFAAMDNAVAAMRMNPKDRIPQGIYPAFAFAGAELARKYYKALYPLAERAVSAKGK